MNIKVLKEKNYNHTLLTDSEILFLWQTLESVPISEDEKLETPFFIWGEGADKYEDVWAWFDKNFSKGINGLLYT